MNLPDITEETIAKVFEELERERKLEYENSKGNYHWTGERISDDETYNMSIRCFNTNCKSQSRWQISYVEDDEEIFIYSCADCLPLLMSKKQTNSVTFDSSFVDKVIDFFSNKDNIISNGNEEKEDS